MHSCIKSKLPSVTPGEEGKQACRDLHREHSTLQNPQHCFFFFSHFLPPVLSSCHTPLQAHNLHTRQDEGLLTYSLSGLQRSPRRDTLSCIQKPPPPPGAGPSLASLPLAFSQTEKQGNACLSPGHQAKHPAPWGNLNAPGSAPCPFLPSLLHITHASHQTSYQSLQQMHSLLPAQGKAATTQSYNLVTACNELTGK